MKMKSKKLALPYAIWMAVFTLVPLVLILINSFQDSNGNFTWDNMVKAWEYRDVFLYSLKIALISTLVCLLLAYPMSYMISRLSEKAQSIIIMLITVPMWMNFLLRLLGWVILLQDGGPIDTVLNFIGIDIQLKDNDFAVILGMVYEFLPFMIMPLHTVMSKIDKSLIEAAQDLGANPFRVFSKIMFPLSIPGIISGVTMVFVPSASTFLVAKYLGGNRQMIGDIIEATFNSNRNIGSALSLCLMIVILLFIILANRFGDEEAVGV